MYLHIQHSQWLRQRRQAEEDIRFIERIVFFNESVNYTKDTIRIADTDNVETDRFVTLMHYLFTSPSVVQL